MAQMDDSLLGNRRQCRAGLLLCLLAILSSPCHASPRSSYALFHRLGPALASANSSTPVTAPTGGGWQKRAVLEIASAAEVRTADPVDQPLQFTVASFSKSADPLVIPAADDAALPLEAWEYQISLVPLDSLELPGEGGHPDTGFAISSFPLCAFLQDDLDSKSPLSEYLNIWVRPSSSGKEASPLSHNLQLDLLGIQWSSSLSTSPAVTCRPSSAATPHQTDILLRSKLEALALNHRHSHMKVSVRRPERLSEPIMNPYPVAKPPEFLPDGSVKPPPPEKGWLAKYWMYILPVVVMLVVGGGPPPPEEAADQQQAAPAVRAN
ncbi:hypothetical protein PTTG_08279 [Puccinia triticina 1-1 BBBD Race 1]|uniref:ER membrane protein complex subunit 10 n=2 Tax=Puccinia triticina TaxID=208348 RepID=A0A180GKJ1_PUCT1|nr:uncharacterized protein PtA15_16A314 [Puccinia triticina]OAV93071.1 hypothetical protein PTTG_08279 [Puccinia triticina 1-1 BBBD Race 1]WAQ92406.1 hypothetical protein PtA15_16A314 [Puccinia triticina]